MAELDPATFRPETRALAARSPQGSWTTLPVESGPAETFVFSDGTLVFGGQGVDAAYLADTWWLADAAVLLGATNQVLSQINH
jgi:hypothetical protein